MLRSSCAYITMSSSNIHRLQPPIVYDVLTKPFAELRPHEHTQTLDTPLIQSINFFSILLILTLKNSILNTSKECVMLTSPVLPPCLLLYPACARMKRRSWSRDSDIQIENEICQSKSIMVLPRRGTCFKSKYLTAP